MPAGNYRSVSIKDELVDRVKELIEKIGTYHSVAEFVSESVRLRVENLEKQHREEQPTRKEKTRCPNLKANRPN